MELDFDSWEDYKPLGDGNVEVNEVENPNVFKLKIDDNVNLLEIEKDDFEDIFEYNSEEDYNGNVFIRFVKLDDCEFNESKVIIFSNPKNEDIYLLKKEDKIYFINVYQSGEYYQDDNKLTFTGWDYNIIINIEKMTAKTQNIR